MKKIGLQTSLNKEIWQGLSSETKPILTMNETDSKLFLTDTKQEFVWTGTSWVEGTSSDYWTNFVSRGKAEKIPYRDYFVGDAANRVCLTPPAGKRIRLQVILIVVGGSGGDVFVYRSSEPTIPILPLDISSGSRVNTTAELNLLLNVNETVTVTTTGRNSNWNFIGLGHTLE